MGSASCPNFRCQTSARIDLRTTRTAPPQAMTISLFRFAVFWIFCEQMTFAQESTRSQEMINLWELRERKDVAHAIDGMNGEQREALRVEARSELDRRQYPTSLGGRWTDILFFLGDAQAIEVVFREYEEMQ